MSGLIAFYRGAGRVFDLAAPLWLNRRAARGKEDPERLTERLGQPGLPRPDGPLIWVHAASVGETVSALPLLSALQAAQPDTSFLLTTATTTAAQTARHRLPDGMAHQFAPLDTPSAVDKFLTHWQPSTLLLIESELWPNMITMAKAAGVRIALVNGRLSEKSHRRWQRFGAGAGLIRHIDLVLAQNEKQAARFRSLGATPVMMPGNLKWTGHPLPADDALLTDLRRGTGARPHWLAASTHPGEERQIADAHIALCQDDSHPDLLTFIAPRHPERGPAIAKDLSAMGLSVRLRSRGEAISPDAGIYIADTLGELGSFYALCDLVFMGGSLTPRGGHNPLEAARAGCCLITGPRRENFADIYDDLFDAKAAISLTPSRGLAFWAGLALSDPGLRKSTGRRARDLTQSKDAVMPAILKALTPLLPED